MARSIEQLHEEVLYPVVRIRAMQAGGSGTVLYSQEDKEGKVHTFVLTNHHVVDGLIKVEKQWDSRLGKEIKKDVRATAEVQFFKYNNWSRCIGSFSVEADIVAYNKEEDMALLELRDRENIAPHVAHIVPKEETEKIYLFDEIHACGATLGHPPIATPGTIQFMDDEIDNVKFWLGTSLISYGNSGGAVFRERETGENETRFEFLGIPSRISLQGWGDAANWMGYFIPPNRVFEFFEKQMFEFVVDPTKTLEECAVNRRKAMERERRLLESREGVVDEEGEEEESSAPFEDVNL